ncbi:hypothetical protein Tco_1364504, partial [Tanacetum coccineum]
PETLVRRSSLLAKHQRPNEFMEGDAEDVVEVMLWALLFVKSDYRVGGTYA